jgi:diguanylate cyclase (GGDEF)-like protein
MEKPGSLSGPARRRSANIQCIALSCAALLVGALLTPYVENVRLWAGAYATKRWLGIAEMLMVAVLLGLSVAAYAAGRRNLKNRDIERRQRSQAASEACRDLAMEDPLTELPTGRAIAEALKEAIECSRGTTLAFYLIDLDGFKSVNNAYGSATGDAMLRLIALRLRTVARRGDLIARFESDTFAVLAHDIVCRREAIDIRNRYLAALDEPISINNRAHAIGVTAGLAYYPEDGTTPEELMRHADLALRSEKARRQSEMQFFVALTYAPAV